MGDVSYKCEVFAYSIWFMKGLGNGNRYIKLMGAKYFIASSRASCRVEAKQERWVVNGVELWVEIWVAIVKIFVIKTVIMNPSYKDFSQVLRSLRNNF